jgi:hypothetical protein
MRAAKSALSRGEPARGVHVGVNDKCRPLGATKLYLNDLG